MAGIKDVAREAGVSASTVSYVLSGKRSISAKTTDKVMAAVEKLGYTPVRCAACATRSSR